MLLNLENCHLHFQVFLNECIVDLGPVLAAIFKKHPYLCFGTCLNLVQNIGNTCIYMNVERHRKCIVTEFVLYLCHDKC